ncbi:TPA: hypothetical protein ACLQU7_004817 [Bacillus tropicus]|nr:hypothetical protein [Bacillus tropicus]QPS53444.1 hypothetical protein I6G54_28830 [Bacillus tropicus]
MEQTSLELELYKNLLIQDKLKFNEQINKGIQLSQGENGELNLFKIQIKKVSEEIQEELLKISTNHRKVSDDSLMIFTLVTDIIKAVTENNAVNYDAVKELEIKFSDFSVENVGQSVEIIHQKYRDLKELTRQVSEKEMQITRMNLILDNVTAFSNLVERESFILKYIVNEWEVMYNTMNQIQTSISADVIDGKNHKINWPVLNM